jgi:hypothetical protein
VSSIRIDHEFVEYMPNERNDGVLYISIPFNTVVHNCFCGCGHKVVTPLSPADWQLSYDGASTSLTPSIGSWNLPCRSHYWIQNDAVHLAGQWTERQIAAGKVRDARALADYFERQPDHTHTPPSPLPPKTRWLSSLFRRFRKEENHG